MEVCVVLPNQNLLWQIKVTWKQYRDYSNRDERTWSWWEFFLFLQCKWDGYMNCVK
jgi:hypothetical protein